MQVNLLDEVARNLRPRVSVASRPISRARLTNRMADLKVPSVSIAAWDRGTVLSRAWGASPSMLFQAASVSKAVTAMGVLSLVGQGVLDLNEEVNDRLSSWHLPEGEGVTVRRILSHSAGLSLSGFPGIPTDAAIPSPIEVLDGTPPSNTEPVRVVREPGQSYLYSGGAFVLLQLLIEDATGEPFVKLMQSVVLNPLGMASSTFAQPLPPELHSVAVSGYDEEGVEIKGRWLVYPEAAGGLSTNPSDLLLAVAEMLEPARVLSTKQRDAMLTPQVVDHHGLGWALEGAWFQHGGSNAGFHSLAYGSVIHQVGAVVMTNGENGWPLCTDVMATVAEVMEWPGYLLEKQDSEN